MVTTEYIEMHESAALNWVERSNPPWFAEDSGKTLLYRADLSLATPLLKRKTSARFGDVARAKVTENQGNSGRFGMRD